MILSITTSYALRILIHMAGKPTEGINAVELHKALNIKIQYMRRVLTTLANKGLVTSSKGRNGGFILARAPQDIPISDVIDAIEGFESFEACVLGVNDCKRIEVCEMHNIWAETKNKMINTFSHTMLSDLVPDS